MRYTNHLGEYTNYNVKESAKLLDWLLANLQQSKSKTKATLQ